MFPFVLAVAEGIIQGAAAVSAVVVAHSIAEASSNEPKDKRS